MPPRIAHDVDKSALLSAFRQRLQAEVEASRRRALDAAEAVVHEDNRPENDKDMRSTEASYLARGQAERVHELESALAKVTAMPLRSFGPDDAIQLSALVDVRAGTVSSTYFLVPAAGGEALDLARSTVTTLATTSPLGRALLGLYAGDEAELNSPQGPRRLEILRVR
jgi:transcription elongation GreA/GreB family factor